MIIRPAADFDLYVVCRNMRRLNAEETLAMRGHVDGTRVARELNALKHLALFRDALATDAGELVAICAAYRIGELSGAAVHLIATEKWPEIAHQALRYFRRIVIGGEFPAHGILYAATDVLDRGFDDRKWLRALGFADEGPPAAYGHHGEMFQRVAWRAVDAPAAALASPHPEAAQETAAHV